MIFDQLIQAMTLFCLGMGTVFVLLTILISCISLLSIFCKNARPENAVVKINSTTQTDVPELGKPVSDEESSVIKAVIKKHLDAIA